MTKRKVSIRRLFHGYCEVVRWAQPCACSVADCNAPAAQSEYGIICLAGHVTDGQGAMPIGRTADLALAIVPAVRRDAQKRYARPDYATLPDRVAAIEARGWLWECGRMEHRDERGRYYARLWLPNLDPLHYDESADERWGHGETIEAAMQQALEALPPKVSG